MTPADLEPLLALDPEADPARHRRRPRCSRRPQSLAACLSRGIGLEAMTNAAAARTFNVLAGEGRRVVAGFVLIP